MSSLREHLEAIYAANGALTPSLVVDAARDPESPLHDRFEWDDSIAGERYREQQARQLIRTVRVVEPKGDKDETRVRAFHSVPRPEGQTYMPVEDIKADPFTRQLVLKQAEREFRAMWARYRHLAEFLDLVAETVESERAAV